MAESAGKKAGKVFVWILLALLIVGLAGFGIGSFGGSATRVGSVGDRDITAQEYFRSLLQAVRAQQAQTGQALTLPEAQAIGLPLSVRAQLAGAAALDNEADRLGLSVGDLAVAQQVRDEAAFQGLDGSFDREAYEFTLQQNGWSVSEFEDNVRAETARAILQGAVAGGVRAPDGWIETVMDHIGERRSYSWVRFGADTLAEPLPARSDADIRAYYDDNPAAFTLPERKSITYAWLRPEDVLDEVEVGEAQLRQAYEARLSEFVRPERRLVERLVFPDRAAAEAASAALEAGETDFPALVEARELTLADVNLGEVAPGDLRDADDAVFALTEPGIVGPFESGLGPALFRVNAILAAVEIPFEEAADALRDEVAADAARRDLENRIADLDDRLAAGATLEDLAAETEMSLGTIEYYAGVTGEIADYAAFREAADAVTQDDFPEIDLLEDGAIFAVRLDEVLEPSVQPFEAVRAEARAGAEAAALIAALQADADVAQTTAAATGSLSSVGTVETADLVTRDAFLDAVPPGLSTRAFEMDAGETAIVAGESAVYLMRLDEVAGPDTENPRMALLRQAVAAQIGQGIAQDLVQLYAQALTSAAGISFNDAALNAVHSQVFR